MWRWHRGRQADHPAESAVPVTSVPVAPVPARRAEWATLPPIQRSFGPMRPVSPQADLGDSLLSWRNPSFLAPLGHLVSADVPSGVIHRLIEPSAPPATGPVGSPLEFATALRRPKGVVQRVLAPITSWANRESEPADTEPDRDQGTRAGPDPALPIGQPPPAVPAPVPMQAPGHLPSAAGPASVQRSGPVSYSAAPAAALTHAPAPQLPILELPVVHSGTPLERAAESDSAAAPPTTEPAWSGDGPAGAVEDQGGEVPTLGMGPPSSAPQPADGGTGGPADVTGQERRAIAPAVETSGRPTPADPTAQRAGTAESPVAPTPEHITPPPVDTIGVGEVPTLGMAPPPPAAQPPAAQPPAAQPPAAQPVAGEPGGATEVTGLDPGDGASGAEAAEQLMPVAPTVQRAETGTPAPAPTEVAGSVGGGEEAPTLGAGPLPPVTPTAHDAPLFGQPVQPMTHPPGQQVPGPTVHQVPGPAVQRVPGPVVQRPTVQRAAESGAAPPPVPSRSGGTRQLGLGPPLDSDVLPVQLSQAGPTTSPPLVPATPPSVMASPAPAPADPAATQATETTEELPGPVSEVIAPLLGDSGSPLPGAAAATDTPETPDSATAADPTVQTAREPSPPLVSSAAGFVPASAAPATSAGAAPSAPLPVLRVQEPTPPGTEAPAAAPAAPAAPPVVARLIGDRTPPLLTVNRPGSTRTEPGARPRHDAPVQRTRAGPGTQVAGRGVPQFPAQPLSSGPLGSAPFGSASLGSAPLSPAGYPAAAAAPLPVQLDPTAAFESAPQMPVQHTSAPVRHAPAPVVQTTLAQAPEPGPATPVTVQAQEIALDPGVGLADEPGSPGQLPPAGQAGSAPPGAAAAAAAGSPDELAKKLFDPLLRRLKTELRLDRERRGMLTDLRH